MLHCAPARPPPKARFYFQFDSRLRREWSVFRVLGKFISNPILFGILWCVRECNLPREPSRLFHCDRPEIYCYCAVKVRNWHSTKFPVSNNMLHTCITHKVLQNVINSVLVIITTVVHSCRVAHQHLLLLLLYITKI